MSTYAGLDFSSLTSGQRLGFPISWITEASTRRPAVFGEI